MLFTFDDAIRIHQMAYMNLGHCAVVAHPTTKKAIRKLRSTKNVLSMHHCSVHDGQKSIGRSNGFLPNKIAMFQFNFILFAFSLASSAFITWK